MKRLVLCCDGTWNRADQEHDGAPCPTNVVKLAYRVAKRDPAGTPQIIFYEQGVGTGNALDRFSGGAFGDGLEDNILDVYRFLVGNYEPGDEIFLFGFSRGAFTARSIVGMVRKCGILACKHARHYREALGLYRNGDRPADPEPVRFRTRCCAYGDQSIQVRFMGVWDTVGALGIPVRGLRALKKKYEFHDTELSGMVDEACHALAIDEHRAPFAPALWEDKVKEGQKVEQVWFCGAHSDVGGGYERSRDGNGRLEAQLADISLDWMLGKAQGAGLELDPEVVEANPLVLEPLAMIHNSKTGFYRIVPEFDRLIGLATIDKVQTDKPDSTQQLHPSVLARWDTDPKYRPEALARYFKMKGDPRAEAGSGLGSPA
ncbi:MAG TPA: DUF2235 domain-containing protein [Burkholderiales bacterium]